MAAVDAGLDEEARDGGEPDADVRGHGCRGHGELARLRGHGRRNELEAVHVDCTPRESRRAAEAEDAVVVPQGSGHGVREEEAEEAQLQGRE